MGKWGTNIYQVLRSVRHLADFTYYSESCSNIASDVLIGSSLISWSSVVDQMCLLITVYSKTYHVNG